ncbi:MAG: T9SS type A sorting domain-containing protein [Polaribacter sp.]
MKTKLLLLSLFLATQVSFTQIDVTPNQLKPIEIAKITSTETTSYFGNSISFSNDGSVLAIGESGYGTLDRVSSGRVRVYTNETGIWSQKGQDLIGIEDFFNAFGTKVELSSDGNTLAVYDSQINLTLNAGETLADKYGDLAPQYFPYIQVYQFINEAWVKVGADFLWDDVLDVVDMSLSGNGTSIAIAGKTGTKTYELIANTWNQTGQEIPARDQIYNEKVDLSADGKTLIIGDSHFSESNNQNPSWEGQVKVYEYNSTTWTQLGNTIKGAINLGLFGSEVSIAADGKTIAVLASQISNDDYIAVLEFTGGNWVSKGTNIQQKNAEITSMQLSGDGNAIVIGETLSARVLKYNTDWEQVNVAAEGDNNTDGFGKAVTISANGNVFAVGAPNSSNGYVSIFNHNKNSATRFGDEIYGYGDYDKLGSSVAVSGNGNIIAMGAEGNYNDNGTYRFGHVRIFEKTNNGLEQIGVDLRNTTDFDSGAFGSEVSLNEDGTLLAIAASYLGTSNNGAVYVYQRNGDTWDPIGNIITDPKGDRTGSSLAFSDDGSILAVGSGTNPTGGSTTNYKGFTTIYKYNNTNNLWEVLGQQILGEATRDYSGASIDLSGDGTIVAIGAYGNDGETTNGGHGHARVFKFVNNSWEQMGEDVDGNADFNINFGGVVTLSNDGKTLIVSDLSSQTSAGSVEIFNWNNNTSLWEHEVQLKSFKSSGTNNFHRYKFGSSTAISNNKKVLIVGETENVQGKVYVYVKNETGTWVENDLFLKGTKKSGQYFGNDVSLSSNGNTLVVGSERHNQKGTQTGMATVYHLNLCSSVEGFEVFDGVENYPLSTSNNLVINGSAEILPITENGWTTVSGKWEWPIRNVQGVPAKYGHKYFKTTISGAAEIYQDVDVSSFSTSVDAGNQYFYFSAYLQSFQVNSVEDDSQVIVEYRDISGNVLATYDTGLSQITEDWTLFKDTRLAPIGTKIIRVRLKAINNNQFRAPLAYIDNVFLSTTIAPNAVSIPDANFEQYLIDANIDSDATINGQVLKVDIENVTQVIVNDKNISNLTGIQEFTSLVELNAANNQIATIDLSKNLLLEKLYIANNQLSKIDISKNTKLKNLDVGENSLKELDVHLLSNLETLSCYKNQLSTINLISNKELVTFIANENQLKYVDIRENKNLFWLDVDDNLLEDLMLKNENNSKITTFSITGNPNLTCIEVDDVNFSNTNWTNKDATANYSTDCAPSNDDCAKAIPLTFGQQTPGDINSGNANNNPSCATGTVLADVWFSVVVPQSGEFSVQGTGFGGNLKFAIYQTCASLAPIACGENISLKNLTVGTKFYLKVWLESDSGKNATKIETGTFTLKAEESSVLSVDNFTADNSQLLVYPNPAKSSISIELSNSLTIVQVEVYSVLGDKIITQKGLNKSKIGIDVSNLSTGIYFIKAKTNNGVLSKKLIIK